MAGYFNTRTKFYDNIDNILVRLNGKRTFRDSVFTFTIGDEIKAYTDVESFRNQLDPTNKTRIAIAKSSPLDEIIANVCKASGEKDLNIIVTDGIISGSNKKLESYDDPKAEKYYNKDFVNNLRNDIMAKLERLYRSILCKNIGISVQF